MTLTTGINVGGREHVRGVPRGHGEVGQAGGSGDGDGDGEPDVGRRDESQYPLQRLGCDPALPCRYQ